MTAAANESGPGRAFGRMAGLAPLLHSWRRLALVSVVGFLSGNALSQNPVSLDVPYVPTPQQVVDRMLQVAGVKPTDLVMDIGCGDGRMVVTAAKEYGARGFCNDIDPVRMAEARENAQRAGVADKIEFRQGDLYDVDLS